MPETDGGHPRARRGRALAWAFPLLFLLPAAAEAHLFHAVFEPRDNQLTKDYRLVVRLVEFPDENFGLAEAVYRGQQRLRLKPGGFRTWLRRPLEPGMVFKADYQLRSWSGSLEAECRRLDRDAGTMLHRRVETALAARNADAVKAAFREMFVQLIRELLDAIEAHLGEPEAPAQLFDFLARYFSVAHEAYLNINDRSRAVVLRSTLEVVERTLGDAGRGMPPAPEVFHQQRARFLRTLGQALPGA
jgi:hypothetical protein